MKKGISTYLMVMPVMMMMMRHLKVSGAGPKSKSVSEMFIKRVNCGYFVNLKGKLTGRL